MWLYDSTYILSQRFCNIAFFFAGGGVEKRDGEIWWRIKCKYLLFCIWKKSILSLWIIIFNGSLKGILCWSCGDVQGIFSPLSKRKREVSWTWRIFWGLLFEKRQEMTSSFSTFSYFRFEGVPLNVTFLSSFYDVEKQ